MINKKYKEVMRDGNYIIYESGNSGIIFNTEKNKVVSRYNRLFDSIVYNAKARAKKAGFIVGLGLTILSPFIVMGFSSHNKNNKSNINLEKRIEQPSTIQNIDNNATREIPRKKIFEEKKEDFYENVPNYITPAYAKATIYVESAYNPFASSKAGAKGLPQTYFETWKEVFPEDNYQDFKQGVKNRKKSEEFVVGYYIKLDNFLRRNMRGYSSLPEEKKRDYLAAAYNWGIGRLKDNNYRLEKSPKETKNHIKKIRRAYQNYI